MEKLIELLNEWSKTAIENKCNWTDVYDEEGVYFLNLFDRDMTMEMEDVISKRNGFIKWLVENDKINRDKKEIEKSDYDITFTGALTMDKKSDLDIMVDTLLMLLSIEDEPIRFLCEIIK